MPDNFVNQGDKCCSKLFGASVLKMLRFFRLLYIGRHMRVHSFLAITCLLSLATTTSCFSAEVHRLQVDLDGDGKVETIKISTVPTAEEWRRQFIVRIGTSVYTSDYFATDGDLPDVRVIAINRKHPQRQLLIGAPEAASCIFYVLAYSSNKLIPLLRFDSGPDCRAPEQLGTGKVRVATWQGFWHKNDSYRLSTDNESLVLESQDIYTVGVPGAAGKSLVLDGAHCGTRAITPGIFIRVKSFDPKQDRYFIESADGGCGWLPASKLNSVDESIKELPWAG